MTLKYEIDALDGLDDGVKALYQKAGDKYRLAIDGIPKSEDVTGLKAKVEELLAEKKEASARAKAAEEAARKAADEAARKAGDTEALEKSWQAKLAAREAEVAAMLDANTRAITAMTVDATALRLASELGGELGTTDVLLPHIAHRLAVEQRDGVFIAAVRDVHGKPSAATIDELKKEFASNPAFARVVAGSKATGGGADGKPGITNNATAELMKLPPVERMIAARNAAK